MPERSPGDPLNNSNLPQNQGISSFIHVPNYYGFPNAGYVSGMRTMFGNTAPLQKATYNSQNVPFTKMSINYKS